MLEMMHGTGILKLFYLSDMQLGVLSLVSLTLHFKFWRKNPDRTVTD